MHDLVFASFLILFHNFHVSIGKSIDKQYNPSIVIIGAGPAGIATASKLYENGFTNVTILEAEDRIGGRVYTVKFGNYSVDLGGQWVHGQEGNVAFNLAKPFDLLDATSPLDLKYNRTFYESNGNKLNQRLSRTIEDFEGHYLANMTIGNDFESIGEYIEEKFDEEFKNNPEILNERNKYLKNMELERISFDSAKSWRDISASGEGYYKVNAGDQWVNWKDRGYSTILDILMKRFPNPEQELPVMNNTVLDTEVTSVDYLSDEDGPSILITSKNGQLYKADHVVVTVSLGVLKEKHDTLFIPRLPDKKVAAIKDLGFGSVAKIFLLFDEPFWKLGKEAILQFSFMWNDEDKKKIETDPEKKWVLGMYGAITVEHKPKLLTLWVTGSYAKLMESISEDKVFKHSVENLHRFLDKMYNVTEPYAMIRSNWYSNPHFRGTYSYPSVKAQKNRIYSAMLAEPSLVKKPKVLFAGEATSKERFGTVDGAISSGWKAAEILINFYRSLPQSERQT